MILLQKWKNLRLIPSEEFFFRELHDFVTKMEKFEIDSKCRNLKKKAYSGVGVGLRKTFYSGVGIRVGINTTPQHCLVAW